MDHRRFDHSITRIQEKRWPDYLPYLCGIMGLHAERHQLERSLMESMGQQVNQVTRGAGDSECSIELAFAPDAETWSIMRIYLSMCIDAGDNKKYYTVAFIRVRWSTEGGGELSENDRNAAMHAFTQYMCSHGEAILEKEGVLSSSKTVDQCL